MSNRSKPGKILGAVYGNPYHSLPGGVIVKMKHNCVRWGPGIVPSPADTRSHRWFPPRFLTNIFTCSHSPDGMCPRFISFCCCSNPVRYGGEVFSFMLYRRLYGLSLIIISQWWGHHDLNSVSWDQIISAGRFRSVHAPPRPSGTRVDGQLGNAKKDIFGSMTHIQLELAKEEKETYWLL